MYNRLFTKILDSSIWLESSSTRIVWITLLAAMDETGYAHFSAIENLANRARIGVEDTEKALQCLMSDDPNSGNPDNGGKRVERVPGGFMILNADDHRKTLNREIKREQTRLRVAKHRALSNNGSVTAALRGVTSASASVSVLKEGITKGRPKDQKEVETFCVSIGLQASDGEAMWLGWQDAGYGKTRDWKAKIRKWKICGYHPSQKQKRELKPDPNQGRRDSLYEKVMRERAERKTNEHKTS